VPRLLFDDGSGGALRRRYSSAGGSATHIAKWDGNELVRAGQRDRALWGSVDALAVFDDPARTGPARGGILQLRGRSPVANIAAGRLSWSVLSRLFGAVALLVHDDGSGPRCTGGHFRNVGGTTAYGIARWNGANWSAVGAFQSLRCPGQFDLAQRERAYARRTFSSRAAGSATASRNGTDRAGRRSAAARQLSSRPCLRRWERTRAHAGGTFTHAGGVPAARLARWNGTAGPRSGAPTTRIRARRFRRRRGRALFAGGEFGSTPTRATPPRSGAIRWPRNAGPGDLSRASRRDGLPVRESAGGGRGLRQQLGTGGRALATGIARFTTTRPVRPAASCRRSPASCSGRIFAGGGVTFGQACAA
jgi:hypothetical protein